MHYRLIDQYLKIYLILSEVTTDYALYNIDGQFRHTMYHRNSNSTISTAFIFFWVNEALW